MFKIKKISKFVSDRFLRLVRCVLLLFPRMLLQCFMLLQAFNKRLLQSITGQCLLLLQAFTKRLLQSINSTLFVVAGLHPEVAEY